MRNKERDVMLDLCLAVANTNAPAKPALGDADVWTVLCSEAEHQAASDRMLRGFLDISVLFHKCFSSALAALLARKLVDRYMSAEHLEALVHAAMADDPSIIDAARADLVAIYERDPAADTLLTPFLYYKGFQALQWQRVGHWLWHNGRQNVAHFLQNRVSEVFAIDIHPAVPVGRGVFIDHGTGLVVGETAEIGDDVSILQNVTLGGTGKEQGDRHPKVRDGVLLAAGAIVLGNIEIGRRAKVGAGSVVLKDVPPYSTVVGVPARVVSICCDAETVPALAMDQDVPLDYCI
jgi:serine O-acetyltransferase